MDLTWNLEDLANELARACWFLLRSVSCAFLSFIPRSSVSLSLARPSTRDPRVHRKFVTPRDAMHATRLVVPSATLGSAVPSGKDCNRNRSSKRSGSSKARRAASIARAAEHLNVSVTGDTTDEDVTRQIPKLVTGLAACAVALTTAFASPDYALAATSQTQTADASFGNSLLERRRVEETAAMKNLDGVVAEIREEEAKLKALRFEREAERVREINEIRALEEQKARAQVANGNTLCVTPFGVDVVGISQTVALVGAIGAGLTSNARKAEIAELNEKLRLVNSSLRAQIRSPTSTSRVYQDGGVAVNRSGGLKPGDTDQVDTQHKSKTGPMDSMDLEEENAAAAKADAIAKKETYPEETATDAELKRALRDGRALLKEDRPDAYKRALEMFEKVLTLGRMVGDTTQTRRATRGLAASKRGLGDGKGAIVHLKEVLEMRQAVGDAAGDTDALGAIADIYTEIGDLENAGKYYDLYLDALNKEMM